MEGVLGFIHWLLKLVFFKARRDFDFVTLTPPHFSIQTAIKKGSLSRISFRALDRQGKSTFSQVFGLEQYSIKLVGRGDEVSRAYSEVVSQGNKPLILDVGANVGMAATYFCDSYPEAHVVAIEPESNNFRKLEDLGRVIGFDSRQWALSSKSEALSIFDPGLGASAFRTVRSLGLDGQEIQGISLDEIVHSFKGYIPFMLKLDIEGFESESFSSQQRSLSMFKVIVVEPHDWLLPGAGGMNSLFRQISQYNFDFLMRGENVFFVNNAWEPASYRERLD